MNEIGQNEEFQSTFQHFIDNLGLGGIIIP
jgi:hypothetical protein